MTLKQAIQKAVTERNARMAGRIVDNLRFKHGFDYDACRDFFGRCSGITAQEFEALMYESDTDGSS